MRLWDEFLAWWSGDLEKLVLNKLYPLPKASLPFTQKELDVAVNRCMELRIWVSSTELGFFVRREYIGWIKYCEMVNQWGQQSLNQRKRVEALASKLFLQDPP